jgi:hypothetical protein
MRSTADISKIFELAQFCLNERGYIVIGSPLGQYEPGQVIKAIWNVELDHPFRVVERTDFSDWKEQCKMASRSFPQKFKESVYKEKHNADVEMDVECYFYRVITD